MFSMAREWQARGKASSRASRRYRTQIGFASAEFCKALGRFALFRLAMAFPESAFQTPEMLHPLW
jgi:hypothetical protein